MRRTGWIGLLAMVILCVLAWADARPLSVPLEPVVPAAGEMAAGAAETARAQGGDFPRPTTPAADATQAPAWHLRPETVPFSELTRLVPSVETLSGGAAYRVAEGQWGGMRQRVHVLTVDPAGIELQVRPVLSFNRLFGFETLSEMAEGEDVLAAVNGGFADTVGRPAGTVMIGRTLLHPADKRFPSLILGEGLAKLMVLETAISLEIGDGVLPVDGYNPWPAPSGISVFTPAYGSTNRMDTPHLAIVVAGGRIAGLQEATAPVPIPSDGFVVAAIGEPAREALVARGKVGGPCTFAVAYSPELPPGTRDAMSCGSFLLREGVSVVPAWDAWVGPMDGAAPRTVVGLGSQGQLVFVVAEGRIRDGPSGFTGKALGELLVGMGLEEAAMLDGGASSELIVGDVVMNRLSAGTERLLPSGFVLLGAPVR